MTKRRTGGIRMAMAQALCLLLANFVFLSLAQAQELAPRAYWPAPVGTKLAVFGYQFSTGDIITDPTLPVLGVQSDINYAGFTYQQFVNWFDRTASVQVSAPYSWGTTEGYLNDDFVSRNVDGIGDLRIRAAINLLGAPAMDVAGMQALRADPHTIAGFSLTAQFPTGTYNPDRLLNVGTNRWSLKPAFGVIFPLHPTWLLELEAGLWLFGDNDEFLGQTRAQDPLWAGEAHLVKRFRPGFWASADLNYYAGGETRIDGGPSTNFQRNSRAGVTMVFPFGGGRTLRLGYSRGIVTKTGGDFQLFSVNFILGWR